MGIKLHFCLTERRKEEWFWPGWAKTEEGKDKDRG